MNAITAVGDSFDFSGLTDAIPGLVTSFVPAAGLVLVAGLGVMGVIWGFPKLVGLFKKTAK